MSKEQSSAHEGNRKEKLLSARLRGMRTKTYTCGENEKEKELEGLELKKIGVCAREKGSERGSNFERE